MFCAINFIFNAYLQEEVVVVINEGVDKRGVDKSTIVLECTIKS